MKSRPLYFLFFFLAACPGLMGCSRPAPNTDEAELNLRRIVQAYNVGISEPKGHPPKTVEEISRYFLGLGDKRDPEKILRSPRDGEPYVIILDQMLDPSARDIILAYEKQGKEGKRYVVTLSQDIKILSDEEFAAASFAGGHQPALTK